MANLYYQPQLCFLAFQGVGSRPVDRAALGQTTGLPEEPRRRPKLPSLQETNGEVCEIPLTLPSALCIRTRYSKRSLLDNISVGHVRRMRVCQQDGQTL